MKISNSFKIVFGIILILLVAVISGVYHVDFNKYLKSANRFITSNSSTTNKIKVSLVSCIDGDTAKFNEDGNVYTYRFLGINTPEVNPEVEKYGKEASNFTCEKLKNADNIYISYEKTSIMKDKYDRHLVWVYIDDEMLQELLIDNGYAKVEYIYTNLTYISKLYEKEKVAKEKKINIYKDYKEKKYGYKKYIVIFKNISIIDEITVNKGSRVPLISNPKSNGKKFAGWTLNGKLYDLSKPVTQDLILEASFE